jgi:prepilin-type processing-associated H-X9-DG protein
MSFRLWIIFYVFALAAAAMATFGPGGLFAASMVSVIWIGAFSSSKPYVRLIQLLIAGAFLTVLITLLLPIVQASRGPTLENICRHQLKQIVFALHAYENANGRFPPASVPDASGRPMHSWRVLILPYIEEKSLYQKYDFNEPWNGPNNRKLAKEIPAVFICPGHSDDPRIDAAETHYFAIVGKQASWPSGTGRKISEFTDGSEKTIMLIEASGLRINWMEPRDVSMQEAVALLTKAGAGHVNVQDRFLTTRYYESAYRNVAYCDGHVTRIGQLADADLARSLLTAAGNEPVPIAINQKDLTGKATTVVKWGIVWSLTTFVVLSLLPLAWIGRRGSKETTIAGENVANNDIVDPSDDLADAT